MLKTSFSDVTMNDTSVAPTPQSSSNFTGLIGLLLSFSAIRDWLKLLLMGAAFESFRQTIAKFFQYISDKFWFEATLDSEDDSYSA